MVFEMLRNNYPPIWQLMLEHFLTDDETVLRNKCACTIRC